MLPATSVAVAVRLWAPLVSAAVVKLQAPAPLAVAAAEQGGAVIDLDRGIGFRRAGERQGIVIGDAVARHAAVGRVRGNASGSPGPPVSMVTLSAVDEALVLPATSVAVARQAVGAVGERGGGDRTRCRCHWRWRCRAGWPRHRPSPWHWLPPCR